MRWRWFGGVVRDGGGRLGAMPAGRGGGGAAAVPDAAGFEPLVSGFIRRVFVDAVVSVPAERRPPGGAAAPRVFGAALRDGGRRRRAGPAAGASTGGSRAVWRAAHGIPGRRPARAGGNPVGGGVSGASAAAASCIA